MHKGSVALFVHNSVNCKEQPDVSKSDYIIETLPTDIIKKKKQKKPVISSMYRAQHCDGKLFKSECKSLIKADLVSEKQLFVIGDININPLDYESNIIKSLLNCLFLRLKIYFPTAIGNHCALSIIQMFIMSS